MSDPQVPEPRPHLKIALLGIAVSIIFLGSMLVETDGHFVPQVADLYLIAQYAKGFAEGHPFQFNVGDAPTTGATSLLHTVFLAVAHLVGFRGEGLIAFAILSGAVFAVLTALQAYRASRCLSPSADVAMLSAVLILLNGPLAWSFHYGADIALVLFLAMWLFRTWIEPSDSGSGTRFILPACLLAFTRPEALLLVSVLAVWLIWDAKRQEGRWRLNVRWLLPVACGVASATLVRIFTGSAANTSFSQKLLSENWGLFSAAVFSVEYWSDLLRGVLLGFYPSTARLGLGSGNAPFYAPPLLLIFVGIALLRRERETRRALGFLVASLATIIAITPTIHMGVHSNRYVLFTLPPLLVLFCTGLKSVSDALAVPLDSPAVRIFRSLAAVSVVFGLLSVARFALVYADAASSVYRQDEAVFDFILKKLPENASFLSNGVSIEYRTGRRSVNLSGVVSPGFSEILPVETEASAFELLSRKGAGPLPPYLIASNSYIDSSPAWEALVGGPPLFVTSSLASSELAIYPTRSDLLGRQSSLISADVPATLKEVDTLNVTDPLDERAHHYRWRSSVGTRSLFATLKLDTYTGTGRGAGTVLADGGRIIIGSEEMTLDTPQASSDLWIVVRTNPEPSARLRHPEGERRLEMHMTESVVRFNTSRGRTDWIKTTLVQGWNEVLYQIPSAMLTPPMTTLTVEGTYASYYYRAFQQAR
ncbi:MAG: hypothetical protein ABI672_08080 [Vicinamibacteria bacterium]